ncbi:hypothetical protein Sros01_38270 [Streptomyces roseochromogenus]|nr:hypothetical protein Sros01_38270 [Streptomyces roseochromogenus]
MEGLGQSRAAGLRDPPRDHSRHAVLPDGSGTPPPPHSPPGAHPSAPSRPKASVKPQALDPLEGESVTVQVDVPPGAPSAELDSSCMYRVSPWGGGINRPLRQTDSKEYVLDH